MSGSRAVKASGHGAGKTESGRTTTIIREEALRETENRSGVLVRVEPEKLTVETASSQPTSGRIVIRTHGVEAEFPKGTDIGILAGFVKALSHA